MGMCRIARAYLLRIVASLFLTFSVTSSLVDAQVASPTASAQTTTPAAIDRSVSLRELPGNILADQKDIWLFPTKLAKGKHWWPTIGVLGVTAGFMASDPYSAPPFRTTNDFSGFNRAFSGTNTGALIVAVPAAIYGVGWLRKDSYAKDTALLAGEAFVDGYLLDLPMKAITGRRQPLQYAGNGPYADSFFNGSHNPFHSGGFYSGHAVAAMAVATVIARRYHNHRWVPFIAYGVAGAIGFSRITTSNHFPADVFFGGTMGYVISRYAVLPARF
jgi:membrane-associated phospholipid phosphatase